MQSNKKLNKYLNNSLNPLVNEISKIDNIDNFLLIFNFIKEKVSNMNTEVFEFFKIEDLINELYNKFIFMLEENFSKDAFENITNFFEDYCNEFDHNEINEFSKKIIKSKNKRINKIPKYLKPHTTIELFEKLKTNLIKNETEKKFKNNISGISILDKTGNFIWMDKKSENLFEITVKKKYINFLNIISNSSLKNCFLNSDHIIKNFESKLNYKILSKRKIKKYIKQNNNNIDKDIDYSIFFNYLSTKFFVLKIKETDFNILNKYEINKNIKNKLKLLFNNDEEKIMIIAITKKKINIENMKNEEINELDLKKYENIKNLFN